MKILLSVISLSILTFFSVANSSTAQSSTDAPVEDLFRIFRQPWENRGYPNQRPVFQKPHGFAVAKWLVNPELPEDYQVGAFSQPGQSFSAWLRFSSDTPRDPSDHAQNTVGMGIKLLQVDADVGDTVEPQPQDFILQNHPVFFLDTPEEFVGLVRGQLSPEKSALISQRIAAMTKPVNSLLQTEYWSAVPYRFGKTYAKYWIKPRVQAPLVTGAGDQQNPDFLASDLTQRLSGAKSTCFDFYVQLYVDDELTPVERPTQEWLQEHSAPQKVATLIIPGDQDVNGYAEITETLAYRPGNALAEHAPAGALNLARAQIYQRMSDERKARFGLSFLDPVTLPEELQAKVDAASCPEAEGAE